MSSTLLSLLSSTNEEIKAVVLRCINELIVQTDIKTLNIENQRLFKLLVLVLSKTTRPELLDLTFRLLSVVFVSKIPNITHVEYEILFYTLKEHLHISDEIRGPLEFLKTLIGVKFIKPQIYDIMPLVMDLLFNTEDERLQETAILTLEGFITFFPIDKNLFITFFNDMVKNIENESKFVRGGLVSLISRFVDAHKVEYYKDMVQVFLLKYTTARVNETDSDIKEKLEALIRKQILALIADNNVGNMYSLNEINEIFRTGMILASNNLWNVSFSGLLLLNALLQLEESKTIKKLIKSDIIQVVVQQIDNISTTVQEFKALINAKKEAKKDSTAINVNIEVDSPMPDFRLTSDFTILVLGLYKALFYGSEAISLKEYVINISKLFNHPDPRIQGTILNHLALLIDNKDDDLTRSKSVLGKIIAHLLNLSKKKYYNVEDFNYHQSTSDYILLALKSAPEYYKNVFVVLGRIAKLSTVS